MKIKKQIYVLIFLFVACAGAGAEVKTDVVSPVQKAVDFTLPDQDGKMWTLSETLKDYKAVVLAFYPKDDTGV
jgi:hypothetical protein